MLDTVPPLEFGDFRVPVWFISIILGLAAGALGWAERKRR